MGMVLILLGVLLLYVSESLWILYYVEDHGKRLSKLGYVVCFTPIFRAAYFSLVDDEEK